MVSKFIKKYKKQIIKIVLIVLFIAGVYEITSNDYRFYNAPIATVIDENSEYTNSVNCNNGEVEKYYRQTLTLIIRNTDQIGREVELINDYASSQIDSTKYKKGDDFFLYISKEDDGNLHTSILNVKRDKYTILLVAIFLVVMILIAGKRGILILVTITINILIFIIMLRAYIYNQDFENRIFLLSAVFATLTLLILGGIKKKTTGSIISTIATVWIVIMIYRIVYGMSDELPYVLMNYVSGLDNLEKLFLVEVILGCLGAVMDIAVTINSSVHELVETNNLVSLKEIYKSICEIGYDIMGTMINVLFFTFISGGIPLTILKIVSGYTLLNIIRYSLVFDIIRFLMGAIAIVMAIPISSLVAIFFVRKRLVKKNDN
ncbi:MAG: YibE/F family protein [Lachnotalea sp.]